MTDRAASLVARLEAATSAVIATIEGVSDANWSRVSRPGEWSVGKEAEHVAEAAIYHQWIVRLTIGEKVSSRRPAIERSAMTTSLTPDAVAALIRERTAEGTRLLLALTDEQLDLPTRPPRARDERLASTIERVLIGHVDVHRTAIEEKLGR